MSENKKVYVKLGAVLQGAKGPFIVLGNSKADKPQYNSTVDIKVTDGDGKVLVEGSNGLISLFDPRTRPGITEEQAAKISPSVLFELVIVKG